MEDILNLGTSDVLRIGTLDTMYLKKGDVALVRSKNVPKYGDHYIVVTGPPVQKEHGIRPATDVYKADAGGSCLLDIIGDEFDLAVILKLKDESKKRFMKAVEEEKVQFLAHN